MLAPMNSLTCPISHMRAQDPVYLKDCLHAFDRHSIVHWFEQRLALDNSVDCPSCRHVYPLQVGLDQDRALAINDLFRNLLLPLVVPPEVNQIAEMMRANIPEDEEATIEEVAKAIQELVDAHLRLTQDNGQLRAGIAHLVRENQGLRNDIDELMIGHAALINQLTRNHAEQISQLIANHTTQINQLMVAHAAEVKSMKQHLLIGCAVAASVGTVVGGTAVFFAAPVAVGAAPVAVGAAPVAAGASLISRISRWLR